MSAVKVDIRDGSRGQKGLDQSGNKVWLSLDRVALVSGLAATGYDRLEEAVDAAIASDSTLDIGAAHPSISNLYVHDHFPDATAPDIVKVRVAYKHRGSDSSGGGSGSDLAVTVGTALRQVPANTDKDGNVILVPYNGWTDGTAFAADAGSDTLTSAAHGLADGDRVRVTTSAGDLPEPLAAGTTYFVIYKSTSTLQLATTKALAESGTQIDITDAGTGTHTLQTVAFDQGGMTTADEQITTLHFRRTETGSPGYFREKSRTFAGHVNAGPWEGVDPICEAREYKCTRLQATSNGDGSHYTVDYDFEFRSRTAGKWDQIIYYIDPATGKPPADADGFDYTVANGNGWIRVVMNEDADFNELNLSTD